MENFRDWLNKEASQYVFGFLIVVLLVICTHVG
jgi:hypothetical protein